MSQFMECFCYNCKRDTSVNPCLCGEEVNFSGSYVGRILKGPPNEERGEKIVQRRLS